MPYEPSYVAGFRYGTGDEFVYLTLEQALALQSELVNLTVPQYAAMKRRIAALEEAKRHPK